MADSESEPRPTLSLPPEVRVTVTHVQPPPTSPESELKNSDFKDMFDLYRKQLEHEDALITHRVTFSTVVQGALVTAFVFVFNFVVYDKDAELQKQLILELRRGICYIGIGLVAYAFLGIMAAVCAWHRLARKAQIVITEWKKWAEAHKCPLPLPERPFGGGSVVIHFFGTVFGPWAFVVFGFMWGYALYLLR
jgi:hypothetical protein